MAKPLPPSAITATDTKPWYRQAWPWALILGPAVVVVACAVTIWLAVKNADPVVVDDYYKEGLAINRSLERDQAAARLGLRARLEFAPGGQLKVDLQSSGQPAWPDALKLQLAHPMSAERDLRVTLHVTGGRGSTASYRADAPLVVDAVRYRLVLQDAEQHWRLAGHGNPVRSPVLELRAEALAQGAASH